ncbi:uncharacterized protein LOC118760873 [Octopus sinensis]|uniref:Uncharacterized protein LOC118760873 n=1 Tax=Octopus sinensis TaxID=2607531 RepID=A0A7E6EG96_9MOLL|nr:uncharacterized protein LOC118760873 [Octopus sinensis]
MANQWWGQLCRYGNAVEGGGGPRMQLRRRSARSRWCFVGTWGSAVLDGCVGPVEPDMQCGIGTQLRVGWTLVEAEVDRALVGSAELLKAAQAICRGQIVELRRTVNQRRGQFCRCRDEVKGVRGPLMQLRKRQLLVKSAGRWSRGLLDAGRTDLAERFVDQGGCRLRRQRGRRKVSVQQRKRRYRRRGTVEKRNGPWSSAIIARNGDGTARCYVGYRALRKVATVKDWPDPACVRDLRNFLGRCTYCRRLVGSLAALAVVLPKPQREGANLWLVLKWWPWEVRPPEEKPPKGTPSPWRVCCSEVRV